MAAFELEGLVKRFNDFQLGPLSLTMEPGAVLAYIGPNGAGKSTTMHCMMGLQEGPHGGVKLRIRTRAGDRDGQAQSVERAMEDRPPCR